MSREPTPPPGSPPDTPDEEAIRTAVAALARQLGAGPAATERAPAREAARETARPASAGAGTMATTRRVTIRRPSGAGAIPADEEDIWVAPGSAAAMAEQAASLTTRSGPPTQVADRPPRPTTDNRQTRWWMSGVVAVVLIGIGVVLVADYRPWQRAADSGAPVAEARRAPGTGDPAASRPQAGSAPTESERRPTTATRPDPPAPPAAPATPDQKPDDRVASAPGVAPPAGAPATERPPSISVAPAPPAAAPPPGGTQGGSRPAIVAPSFDIVRVSPDGTAVIAGRAAPGSRISLMDGEREVQAIAVGADGQWTMIVDSPPLSPGAHDLRLVQRQDGREVARSDRTVTVVVAVPAIAAPPPPLASQPPAAAASPPAATSAPTAPAAPLVVSTPGSGGPSAVLQAPGGPDTLARSGTLVLGAVDYDEQGRLTVTGQAPPGTTIRLYVDNQPVGDATAGVDGKWGLQPADPVALGKRRVRVDQVGPGGAVVSRLEVPFERMTLARPGVVTVVRGDNLWNIARNRYGDGLRYTIIYEANKSQIRDPDLIYPGQTFVIPKTP